MRKKTWILCAAMCVALTGCSTGKDANTTDIIQVSSEAIVTETTTEATTTQTATTQKATTTESVTESKKGNGESVTGNVSSAGKTETATTEAQVTEIETQDGEPADDSWKEEFEKTLYDEYGVVPDHYEYIGNDVYQVYVEIDGKVVPYVAVNCKTGDFHG